MLKKSKENIITLIVIFLINALFLYSSLNLEFFESKIFPIFISGLLFLLLLIAFYNEYEKLGCSSSSKEPDNSAAIKAEDIKTVKCLLPLFLLTALIYVFGFYASTLLFVFIYMKASGSKLPETIIISAASTVFIYVVFPILLETPLYTGLLMQHFDLPF